jgi:hypothetical protein
MGCDALPENLGVRPMRLKPGGPAIPFSVETIEGGIRAIMQATQTLSGSYVAPNPC